MASNSSPLFFLPVDHAAPFTTVPALPLPEASAAAVPLVSSNFKLATGAELGSSVYSLVDSTCAFTASVLVPSTQCVTTSL
ncbi:hypothetical protein D3C84_1187730 [compost metagenome]